MICDLHTHSVFSDGTLTPRQLLQAACDAGLSAIALTDHNTVAGLPDFLDAAPDFPVKAIPGIEFSVDYLGTELHLLALYVRREHFDIITKMMEDFKARKERSNRELVDALNKAGFALDYDAIKATASGYVNRAHIGAAMTEKGYVVSIKEAFKKYLSPSHGYYVPPMRADVFETIRFIRSIGAVPVLAHPFLNLDEAGLRAFLPEAVQHGLVGIETLYPMFNDEQTHTAQAIATEFGLLPSGGSDFHGENKPHIRLGIGQGALQVPECYEIQLRNHSFFS